jgi:surface carbohydrate biosynthesis protein
MNLYITVETTSRELDAKIFLACCAALEGFHVTIGQENMMRRFAKLSKPGIFYDKSTHTEYIQLFKNLKRIGHKIAVNDDEGIVIHPGNYISSSLSSKVIPNIDLFFTWGPKQTKLVKEFAPQLFTKTICAGNPRCDLLRKELRKFYLPSKNTINREFGNFILINTNFSFSNSTLTESETIKKIHAGDFGPAIDFLLHFYNYEKKICNHFKKIIIELGERYPTKKFIVRPHPSESIKKWKNILKNYPNIFVIRKGNVHPWLLACDMMIHNGCTTAVEGFLLDTLCVAYRPITSDKLDQHFPNSVSYNAFDKETLFNCIEGKKNEDFKKLKSSWEKIVKDHISFTDKKFATHNIIKNLKILSKTDFQYDHFKRLTVFVNEKLHHYARATKFSINKRLNTGERIKKNTKWISKSPDEIKSIIKKFYFYDQICLQKIKMSLTVNGET